MSMLCAVCGSSRFGAVLVRPGQPLPRAPQAGDGLVCVLCGVVLVVTPDRQTAFCGDVEFARLPPGDRETLVDMNRNVVRYRGRPRA